ncbi:MAG: urease accessory protein, partial [Nitrospina sp.]|nr:urease accessory protein [Nitrospina sp.]
MIAKLLPTRIEVMTTSCLDEVGLSEGWKAKLYLKFIEEN